MPTNSPSPRRHLRGRRSWLLGAAVAITAAALAGCAQPTDEPTSATPAAEEEHAEASLPQPEDPQTDQTSPDAEHRDPELAARERGTEEEPFEPADEPSDEPNEEPTDEAAPALSGRVIALDPGHNGGNFDAPDEINEPVDAGTETKPCNTPGAVTDDGYRESTFNLELAEHLRAELEQRGAEVTMTREDDEGVGPCIDERGTFGQDVGADVFLSIHADGADPAEHGFHVIRPAGWEEQPDAVVESSEHLATTVRDELLEIGMTPATYVGTDGIHPRSDLGTLNLAEVPAILLEAGNMHNADDIVRLREDQPELAHALAEAIEAFLAG